MKDLLVKEHLKFAIQVLSNIDNNPYESMKYITVNLPSTNIINKSPDNCRFDLLSQILLHVNRNVENLDDSRSHENVDIILYTIDKKYSIYQHHQWRAHESHFHTSFQDYINCPVTCICEMTEFLTKMYKEIYCE